MLAGGEKSLGNWRARLMSGKVRNNGDRASGRTPEKIAGQVEGHRAAGSTGIGRKTDEPVG